MMTNFIEVIYPSTKESVYNDQEPVVRSAFTERTPKE